MKKLLAIVLCIVMAVSAVACSGVTEENTEPTSEPTATADKNAVAIKVGNQEITVDDIENAYDSYLEMNQYYGQPAPTEEADIEAVQDMIVGELIAEKMKLHMASQLGCDTLTDEQQKELDKQMGEETDALLSYYKESEDQSLSDEEKIEQAKAKISEDLAANGWDMDYDGYVDYIRNYYREGYVLENLEALIKKDATVTDEKVQEYYDNLLSSQKMEIEADPTAYISTEIDFEKNGGDPAVIVPEGCKRIKVIKFEPETGLAEEYTSLEAQKESLEEEYGRNALAADGDKARMQEIKKEYDEVSQKAEAMYTEHISGAKTAAEETYARLTAGEDFDAVLKEVNPDSEYVTVPAIAEKGNLIMPGDDDGVWSETIREAVKELKDGTYSAVIQDEDCFYIIYLLGNEPAGEIPLETVMESIKACALEAAQNTLWEEKQEEWESDSSLVVKNEELYRGIGK